MNSFRLTRVYSDQAGDSHFEDIDIDLTDKGHRTKNITNAKRRSMFIPVP
jgi:hypothetical protein